MKPNWFVGLPVPADEWLPGLLHTLPDSCRGFQAGDVHMTVAFLGAMDPALEDDVAKIMEGITFTPFGIGFTGIVALPSARRVSALSLKLDAGGERATDLIARWRGPLIDAAHGRPDHRPPLPHVTVARPIRRFGAEGRRQAIAWAQAAEPPAHTVRIDRLALYTWAHDRRSAQFRIVRGKTMC